MHGMATKLQNSTAPPRHSAREAFVPDISFQKPKPFRKSPGVRAYNDFSSQFKYGVELLPEHVSLDDLRFRLADETKFMSVRPYRPHLDDTNHMFKYTIEITDGTFKQLLTEVQNIEKRRQQQSPPSTSSSSLPPPDYARSDGKAGTAWVYNPIFPARLPNDVRFTLVEYYTYMVNAARKAHNVTGKDFEITALSIDEAETGIRMTEDNGMSIFDRFKMVFRACFHRPGKSIGHCARVYCLVDERMGLVKTFSMTYIGVLPEELAATKTTTAPGPSSGNELAG